MNRAEFLVASGAALAASLFGRRLLQGAEREPQEPLSLKSWEVVEYPGLPDRYKQFMKVTASNGAFGVSRLVGGCKDLKAVEEIGRKTDLLDHEGLHDAMAAARIPFGQLATFDIACWDLHARMQNKPLHALLGTKKTKILRYGDVRGTQPDFSPDRYAATVARYLQGTGLKATKLHFPGAMGTPESISFKQVLETLRAVRQAVGQEPILAWDPYPGSAESATTSLDEAKQILKLMDELGYAWIEGPLPPVPFDKQIPKYVELVTCGAKLKIQAEGPGSPIGDGTPFEVMKRWVKAGAVNQCSTDAYIAPGVTNAVRMLEYARSRPQRNLTINLHWAWAPHAHLVMAYEEKIVPFAEFPMVEDFPKTLLDGPYLLAPDWPGIYRVA
jgi:L-alanine-DL-glutamate epimerase-like enolase superfamily enzyme